MILKVWGVIFLILGSLTETNKNTTLGLGLGVDFSWILGSFTTPQEKQHCLGERSERSERSD